MLDRSFLRIWSLNRGPGKSSRFITKIKQWICVICPNKMYIKASAPLWKRRNVYVASKNKTNYSGTMHPPLNGVAKSKRIVAKLCRTIETIYAIISYNARSVIRKIQNRSYLLSIGPRLICIGASELRVRTAPAQQYLITTGPELSFWITNFERKGRTTPNLFLTYRQI